MIFITSLILFALITAYNARLGIYLILILIPSFLIRASIGPIPTTFLELSIYILAVIWLIKKTKIKNWNLKILLEIRNWKLEILAPIVLFLLAAIVSTLISPDKRLSLGILKAWFFDPLLFMIILVDQIKLQKHLNKVIASLSLMVLWVSAYGIYEYFFIPRNLIEYLRLDSIFTSANYVTMLLVPVTLLILGKLIIIKSSNHKIIKSLFNDFMTSLLILTTSISLATVYLTRSYSGWLGLGAGLFILLLMSPTKKKIKFTLVITLLVISSIFLYTQKSSPKFQAIFDFNNRTAAHSRLQIWQTSLEIIADHPILGIGLGNFHNAYIEYLPKSITQPLEYEVLKPHNLYLNLWLETGLLGLIAFVWLIVVFYKKSDVRCQMLDAKWISISAMTALLAQGLFDTPYFKNDLSLIFWLIIGLSIIANKSKLEK